MDWNGGVKGLAIAAITMLIFAACQEGHAGKPSPPLAPVPAKPAPVEKAAPPQPKEGRLTEISLEAFFPRQQAGTVLVYDARPSFVSGFGKIPGAISWPRGDFNSQVAAREIEIRAALKAGKIVVIYCTDAACPDSRAVAERLAARGHDVSILQGGYADWKTAGMPTE